ncbi:MAG: protein translocase subunit SecF [Ardenticatenaceae bacterium]|nr:protein translocase subunit SecF [Anaerolineales bacterium]MCB8920719.1 protein translocase subunit SecF [Ardenticatenaceae bacterium]MCB8989678.1 protein translocase subunit SecF [Ardenticatenaceae bacterium]MCB9002863.1 protein translocase subunit SecF [Ardenticatenaceae bacterium]
MYNIVEKRKTYFILSGIIIGLGIAAMIYSLINTGTIFRLGVDFRGGTRFEVQFSEPVTEAQIEDVFAEFGVTSPAVVALRGENLQNAWQIRTEFKDPEEAQAIEDALNTLSPLVPGTLQVQSVSPSVSAEVTRAAFVAIIVAAAVILVYIMFVFRQVPNPFRYGVSAVTAMLHDLFVIFGFAAITGVILGWEVDALFLTAVLTVAGFSLQDTIVVFDRIRENIAKRPLEKYETIVNRSILETIHRSLATQLNAMFVMVAILLFGGTSIKPFIAVLFVGMLSGTYSSIFTAVPMLVSWEKEEIPVLSKL